MSVDELTMFRGRVIAGIVSGLARDGDGDRGFFKRMTLSRHSEMEA